MKKYLSIAMAGMFLIFTVLSSILIFPYSAQAETGIDPTGIVTDQAAIEADPWETETAPTETESFQAVAAFAAVQAATGTLKVHMLKIGDGRSDCFLIQLPNGDTMVIDTPTGSYTPLTNKLRSLGITSIKYLVGTHSHGDHIGAMNNFLNGGFKIDNTQIYYPKGAIQEGDPDYNNLVTAATKRKLAITKLVRHDKILDTIYEGKALKIDVLSPFEYKIDGLNDDDYLMINSASLAVKVTYGDKAMLFMADCQWQTEFDMLADTDTSDLWGQVIKVGHHGVLSGGHRTTTEEFLDKVKPEYAFITNEGTDINGALKSRLQTRNIDYWISGVTGTVWIATDGTNPWTFSNVPTWSEPPLITISDYVKTPTNKDITVTATTSKGTLNADSYTFKENGSFEFVATDTATGTQSRKTVTITNIDKVPPEITIGDYIKTYTNKDITVTATTNEGTLNAASYTFTENGSFEFVATDAAGNVTQKVITITNIDKIAPTIEISSPASDAKYILNQKLLANWSVSDNLSGVASAEGSVNSGGAISTNIVGEKSFSVTAADNAGNISVKTIAYKVIYAFGGFLQPVSIQKQGEAGSTIPLKFQLKDADNNYITNAVAKAYYTKLTNGVPGSDSEAVSTSAAVDGNLFRYDSISNQYIFNLSTKGWELGSYQITVKLDDSTSYSVQVELK